MGSTCRAHVHRRSNATFDHTLEVTRDAVRCDLIETEWRVANTSEMVVDGVVKKVPDACKTERMSTISQSDIGVFTS